MSETISSKCQALEAFEVAVLASMSKTTTVDQVRAVHTEYHQRLSLIKPDVFDDQIPNFLKILNDETHKALSGIIQHLVAETEKIGSDIEILQNRHQQQKDLHEARKTDSIHNRQMLAREKMTLFIEFVAAQKEAMELKGKEFMKVAVHLEELYEQKTFSLNQIPVMLSVVINQKLHEFNQLCSNAMQRFSLLMQSLLLMVTRLEDQYSNAVKAKDSLEKHLKDIAHSCQAIQKELKQNCETVSCYKHEIAKVENEFQELLQTSRNAGYKRAELNGKITNVRAESTALKMENDQLLKDFEITVTALEDAEGEKQKLKNLLEPHKAVLEQLRKEEGFSATEDLRREITSAGAQFSQMVGHRNTNQGIMQAKQYVTSCQDLREENIVLKGQISDLSKQIKLTRQQQLA